ncbi:conserved hypothetical protein [Uncinocarpus reesii 1704]|uniref:RRM domain-containing protein n=1 Tax=Uncinocarpus reesii (strain UAMH 1704) TaxID=336963 RepID=C4JS09_UNCRE|nr:uncharacterized protein UREG_05248 [Uncinocarpus reesii 1704]EEP80406.1 conserved hypothetical protein [Uncinocarpus reesii 1704]
MAIRASASARKAVIKIFRSIMVLMLTLEERLGNFSEKSSMLLEHTIDHFLLALADKDTPVRFAASKALSMVTLKLDPEMAPDIVEAVLEALEEDILYETQAGTLISSFQAGNTRSSLSRRNTNAVDPQKWQGLILTLSQLLFRRALPPFYLDQVLQSLLSGLEFEQRSSTGSSVGGGVRDASCFGIWSIARKYTSREICAPDPQKIKVGTNKDESVLQLLAVELVCAACLDPSGNIRRGASAALQELIGRHPDTVLEGITLVQIVDYHAVARRAKAMQEVAKDAAGIGQSYWDSLLDGLLQWRGIGSPDSRSRRTAAAAIGELSIQEGYKSILTVLRRTIKCLSAVSAYAIEVRHGCLLSLAAVVDEFLAYRLKNPSEDQSAQSVALEISSLWEVLDRQIGQSKDSLTLSELRPDLTTEASARFLSSLARSCTDGSASPAVPRPSEKLLEKAVDILILCVCRGDDIPIEASSQAASDLFALLPSQKQTEVITLWFDNINASWKSTSGRGQISALGAVFKQLPVSSEGRTMILNELLRSTSEEESISKRSSAVKCITTGILPYAENVKSISTHFEAFLNDYTTDRRGDIGSFIRLEAIGGVNFILNSKLIQPLELYDLMKCVVRLTAEKLDKVRFQAWKCLVRFWEESPTLPPLQERYEHLSEVSSTGYFLQLFSLLSVDWIRPSLLRGVATSASAGTEGLVKSSRLALAQYIKMYGDDNECLLKRNVFDDLMLALESTIDDDRYAIPTVDTICFLLDNCFENSALLNLNFRKLFLLVQKSHFKSSNIPRIEAAIKLYSTLLRQETIRKDVMKKMISMLLHSYPKALLMGYDGFISLIEGVASYHSRAQFDPFSWHRPSARRFAGHLWELVEVTNGFTSRNKLLCSRAAAEYLRFLSFLSRENGYSSPKFFRHSAESNVRNLEERVKVDQLKEALSEIFAEYGSILEIVAKSNLKAKGQAFIVFDNVDSATRAIEEINGFELFEKPMVLDYAKTRSDATVLKEAGEQELETHKRRRLAEKERKQAQEALENQKKLKRPAGAAADTRPAKTTRGAGLKPTGAAAAPVIPDEYLPPNKILFLREVPDSYDSAGLTAIFGRFEGFKEVRMVPGRKGIAFVEYESEAGAISAKEATSGMTLGENGKPMRVTYQRQ